MIVGILMLSACAQDPRATKEAIPQAQAEYEKLPIGHLDSLAGLVTQIDYIFYDLPVSMSTGEPGSIRALMSHYDAGSSVPLQHGCKSIGRIFYVSNGENLLSADLFFRDSCRFAVFLKGETPLFAARISDKGASFLVNAGVPLTLQK